VRERDAQTREKMDLQAPPRHTAATCHHLHQCASASAMLYIVVDLRLVFRYSQSDPLCSNSVSQFSS
jgi:ribosome biogenesis GTPase A